MGTFTQAGDGNSIQVLLRGKASQNWLLIQGAFQNWVLIQGAFQN